MFYQKRFIGKYYQKAKERLQNRFLKDIQTFQRKEKTVVANYEKSLKMKNAS